LNDVIVLAVRLALVLLLYLFLFSVVRGMRRDLRSVGGGTADTAYHPVTASPRLMVLAVGQTLYTVGQQFSVRSPMLLGRDSACDIPVEDEFVSGQHLKLASRGAQWLAEDLGSTNGTRLNGTRLNGSAALKHGDILDLGRLRLRFTLEP